MTDMIVPQPWDRQPDETERQYAAFLVYRDLPAPLRSVPRAQAILQARRAGDVARERQASVAVGLPRAHGRMAEWAATRAWVERSRAWDQHLVGVHDEEAELVARERARRHSEAGAALQEIGMRAIQEAASGELDVWAAIRLYELGVKTEAGAGLNPIEEDTGSTLDRTITVMDLMMLAERAARGRDDDDGSVVDAEVIDEH